MDSRGSGRSIGVRVESDTSGLLPGALQGQDDLLSTVLCGELTKLRRCLEVIAGSDGNLPYGLVSSLVARLTRQTEILAELCGPNVTYLGVEQALERATRLHPPMAVIRDSWDASSVHDRALDGLEIRRLVNSPQRSLEIAFGILTALESLGILIACEVHSVELAEAWCESSSDLLSDLESALATRTAN